MISEQLERSRKVEIVQVAIFQADLYELIVSTWYKFTRERFAAQQRNNPKGLVGYFRMHTTSHAHWSAAGGQLLIITDLERTHQITPIF